jgi:hypothetical protein
MRPQSICAATLGLAASPRHLKVGEVLVHLGFTPDQKFGVFSGLLVQTQSQANMAIRDISV